MLGKLGAKPGAGLGVLLGGGSWVHSPSCLVGCHTAAVGARARAVGAVRSCLAGSLVLAQARTGLAEALLVCRGLGVRSAAAAALLRQHCCTGKQVDPACRAVLR